MRFAWTVAGDDPDLNQGDKHGVNGYFFPAGDVLTTPGTLLQAMSHGGGRVGGFYVGAGWWNAKTPEQYVAAAVAEYKRLTQNGTVNKGLRAMFNLEEHDPDRIIVILEKWRAKMPNVGTSWSPEGGQGGLMGGDVTKGALVSSFVTRLLKTRVRVVPQLFLSGMEPRGYEHTMWDVACRGIPAGSISAFHDGAVIQPSDHGFIFTMGRLPWIA